MWIAVGCVVGYTLFYLKSSINQKEKKYLRFEAFEFGKKFSNVCAFCWASRNSSIVFLRLCAPRRVADSDIHVYFLSVHQENCGLHKSFFLHIHEKEEWEYDFSIDSVRLLMTNAQDESPRLFGFFSAEFLTKRLEVEPQRRRREKTT